MTASDSVIDNTVEGLDIVEIVTDATVYEPVLCISTTALTRQELAMIKGTAYFANSVEDIIGSNDFDYENVLIYSNALALLDNEIVRNLLQNVPRVHWHLEESLIAALTIVGNALYPTRLFVQQINFRSTGVIITTSPRSVIPADNTWFTSGIRAGKMETRFSEGQVVKAETTDESQFLRAKLLMALKSIDLIVDSESSEKDSQKPIHSTAEVENQLILLKNRYDALDRKYNSLAHSRLGKLTLKLWKFNRKRI
ncbi:hypothetical protein ACX80D_16905 [Arthrobacter sp. Sr24]